MTIAAGCVLYILVVLLIAQFMGFNDRRGAVERSVTAPQCGRRQRAKALPPACDD